ncbi:thiamine-phosphate kinase [uncultured Serinicoccus sp.]|uniref:thiamine-phosphate kinase n=1 Tax=uncultured Serinicoccus sp. TaxID=735514 RepID=UPI002601AD60|nr:thiamine-phosphate kinase [uncultured Serinicoccus sp.]
MDASEDGGRAGPGGGARTGPVLGEVGERGVLAEVFAALADQPADGVLVGPGDDTAYLRARRGAVLVTTDTMVLGHDWRDDWSTPQDVGVKATTQNLADIASMGGAGTGLLVTLAAHPRLPLAWARGLAEGMAWASRRSGVPVVGGDLSAAPDGVVMLGVTALGELPEGVEHPVLRDGARPGDVLAVSGPLGRSGAGLAQLLEGRSEGPWVDYHRRPWTDLGQGPRAALAGASSMIDVSDGLVRDADRVARASDVRIDLRPGAVDVLAAALHGVPAEAARRAVLGGGEEHVLLATFAPDAAPPGWVLLGDVAACGRGETAGVWLGPDRLDPARGGWDHYGG